MGGSVGVVPANNLVNAPVHVSLLDLMDKPVLEWHGSSEVSKLSRGG